MIMGKVSDYIKNQKELRRKEKEYHEKEILSDLDHQTYQTREDIRKLEIKRDKSLDYQKAKQRKAKLEAEIKEAKPRYKTVEFLKSAGSYTGKKASAYIKKKSEYDRQQAKGEPVFDIFGSSQPKKKGKKQKSFNIFNM